MSCTGSKNGVVELFHHHTPGDHDHDGSHDAESAGPAGAGPIEAIALIQRKLKTQINLIAHARSAGQALPELRAALAELKELTGSIIDDLHRVIPTLTDAEGSHGEGQPPIDLFTRLTQLCSGFRASSGIACVLAVLPKHVEVNEVIGDILFRAVRELLTNVRQHSHASRVEITSDLRADGSVTLTVTDDGIGMPPGGRRRSALESGAVGLSSIDLRLREVGAHMEIESDGGVRARLVVPAHIVAKDDTGPANS
jgi:signal transduction histidine kinase